MSKACSKCRIEKPTSEFNRRGSGFKSHCRDCIRTQSAKYRLANPNKVKDWIKANPEKAKSAKDRYRRSNLRKVAEQTSKYQTSRKLRDPLFKLSCNLRSLIYNSLNSRGFRKSSKSAKLLGAPLEVVWSHLISTAIRNYGFYDPNVKYHIDHIIPCSVAANQEELETLQFYYNLQLLTPKDNLTKSNKLVYAILKEQS
jgi:hypothetical protein